MYPINSLLGMCRKIVLAVISHTSCGIIKMTVLNKQHLLSFNRNQIRNDISCELSDGRRLICNIKVYFLPEILKIYIAICHDRCL